MDKKKDQSVVTNTRRVQPNEELMKSVGSDSSVLTGKLVTFLWVVLLLGGITGFVLAKNSKTTVATTSSSSSSSSASSGTVVGSDDTSTFKDTVEGTVKEGGIEGEGQFHLERPGGESQNVYMTSSTVDLSQFVDKKVKIPHLRKTVGVVFQDLKLLPDRTIFENIILPLEMSGINKVEAKKRVDEILDLVGIENHRDKFPIQLSGGELQRAAIGRALTLGPDILLADEPTGNLDPATSKDIVKLLEEINKQGTTILMATHNSDIVNSLQKRVVTLEKGKLIRDDKKGKYDVS
jgi:ABC-type ATPase involved in cell division